MTKTKTWISTRGNCLVTLCLLKIMVYLRKTCPFPRQKRLEHILKFELSVNSQQTPFWSSFQRSLKNFFSFWWMMFCCSCLLFPIAITDVNANVGRKIWKTRQKSKRLKNPHVFGRTKNYKSEDKKWKICWRPLSNSRKPFLFRQEPFSMKIWLTNWFRICSDGQFWTIQSGIFPSSIFCQINVLWTVGLLLFPLDTKNFCLPETQ